MFFVQEKAHTLTKKKTLPALKQLQNPFTISLGEKLVYENRGLGFKSLSRAFFVKFFLLKGWDFFLKLNFITKFQTVPLTIRHLQLSFFQKA